MLRRVGRCVVVIFAIIEETRVAPWHARMLADTTSQNPWQRPGPAAYPTEGWPGGGVSHRAAPSPARHQRLRHPPGIEEPPTGEVDIAHARRPVLLIQSWPSLVHVGPRALLLGRQLLLL
jgi:hypothetical protein